MKKTGYHRLITLFLLCCFLFTADPVFGDDTCVFSGTADAMSLAGLHPVSAKCPGSNIQSSTGSFSAPVVPSMRTMSGDNIYMALFKPGEDNFWQGNVAKYGISGDNRIVDANGKTATQFNGAMKEDARPYWATSDWADDTKSNYIHNASRHIYTYLTGLTAFSSDNAGLTAAILGNPLRSPGDIINWVRGADVFDDDGDGDVTENRAVITGDVLHSQPSIFRYRYADNSSKTMVYFGANDGMLHAVLDAAQPSGTGPMNFGTEEWAFIPPDQLPRLKEMTEGFVHQFYVDSTPGIYFKDMDKDGRVDAADGDKVVLVCGERKGGFGYFALDVTDPSVPQYLWRIHSYDDAEPGKAGPTAVIAEMGQTWSEPRFGLVKTSDSDTIGTPVLFVGGGYSADNLSGKSIIAVNVLTGAVVKKFSGLPGMKYSFASSVAVIDENDNGFVDKIYVGDLGGQMWRFASFVDSRGNSLAFPNCNENINAWTGRIFFKTDENNAGKFFYPPSVTLEKGYDMVFMGTGDRESACCNNGSMACSSMAPDIIAGVKDTHSGQGTLDQGGISGTVFTRDLVDVTSPNASPPDLTASQDADSNGLADRGWYIRLVDKNGRAVGEKVLAEGMVFNKTLYISTYTPKSDPCTPGDEAILYALNHLTGEPAVDFDRDSSKDRSFIIGQGIPSKPVMRFTKTQTGLFISAGSTNSDLSGPRLVAGIKNIDPLVPSINFFFRYWREVF
jgi:type IV pilus assembly protein PilY1